MGAEGLCTNVRHRLLGDKQPGDRRCEREGACGLGTREWTKAETS